MSKNKWNEYDILRSPLYIRGFFCIFFLSRTLPNIYFFTILLMNKKNKVVLAMVHLEREKYENMCNWSQTKTLIWL